MNDQPSKLIQLRDGNWMDLRTITSVWFLEGFDRTKHPGGVPTPPDFLLSKPRVRIEHTGASQSTIIIFEFGEDVTAKRYRDLLAERVNEVCKPGELVDNSTIPSPYGR